MRCSTALSMLLQLAGASRAAAHANGNSSKSRLLFGFFSPHTQPPAAPKRTRRYHLQTSAATSHVPALCAHPTCTAPLLASTKRQQHLIRSTQRCHPSPFLPKCSNTPPYSPTLLNSFSCPPSAPLHLLQRQPHAATADHVPAPLQPACAVAAASQRPLTYSPTPPATKEKNKGSPQVESGSG